MLGLQTPWHCLRIVSCLILAGLTVGGLPARTQAQSPELRSSRQERQEIHVSSTFAQTWRSGRETVVLLRDRCQLTQGDITISGQQMVMWRRFDPQSTSPRELLTIYVEGEARLERPSESRAEHSLILEMSTRSGVKIESRREKVLLSGEAEPVFRTAQQQRYDAQSSATLQQVQYAPQPVPDSGPELQSVQLRQPPAALRKIRVFPRSGVRFSVESFESKATTPPEQVWVLAGGVNLLVEGLDGKLGTIDLSADRMVIWTQLGQNGDISGETVQASHTPLQVYLEGNIIIRQADHIIRGSQGFYDAREERAIMNNAELKIGLPRNQMLTGVTHIRLRAGQLRQMGRETFQAQNAYVTTSPFGLPGYRLQASDIFIEPRAGGSFGGPKTEIDPVTGEEKPVQTLWTTTLNDRFFVENVPLFYLPYASFPADDPDIPLKTIGFANDQIFGTQLYTTWDLFKILSIERPTDLTANWNLHLDYLSDRGPEIGTSGNYFGKDRFGLQGKYKGDGAGYFIYDTGLDNLGLDRQGLIPKQKERGYFSSGDRWDLPNDITLLSEIGYVSDRNYYEEYREFRFDTGKDLETMIYAKQNVSNWAWSAIVRPRPYNYYTTTEWLPRGDLYSFSEPLFNGMFTWSSHSYATYANQRIADPSTDPNDFYSVLPFEGNGQGAIFATRHGIDMPLNAGPLKVVPYALGEAASWGDDFNGNSMSRLWGSAGVRANVEFWKVFPEVQSGIFGLNGLAHKMVFDADYSISDSNQALDSVPIYNEFDDNAQEQFRRRLLRNTFNMDLPPTLEPRFFALRQGVANNVSTPFNELVATQQVLRFGWRNRLQTKVGPENAQRIKNWMTLDLDAAYFPDAARDNFGQDFGQYSARYAWNVGDRTSILASTYFDTFDPVTPVLWNVGFSSQRTTRGSLYVGLRSIEAGTLDSRIITASYSYVLSPKWTTTLSTAYDLGEQMNRGQTFTITRVGSDFLIHLGGSFDPTRNNVGFGLSIEPKFAPSRPGAGGGGSQLGSLLGSSPQR